MTLEEAIKWLNVEASYIEEDVGNGKEILEAYDMAIKALEQEPCEDCISRQAAVDYCYQLINVEHQQGSDEMNYGQERVAQTETILHHLEFIPSVTPQPKTGRWLEKEVNSDKVIDEWQSARCNVCDKYYTTPYMYYFSHYNYCPNCGARMEVEE